MSHAVQTLLGNRVKIGTNELIKLIDDLGSERAAIKPQGKCRNAFDQAAECTLIVMYCGETLRDSGYTGEFSFPKFQAAKDELAADWDNLKKVMVKNAEDFAAIASTIPDDKMQVKMALPWGELSSEDVMIYPYWNLSYHAGQINYIGFLTE